jgi:hypothetical protein
MVRVAEVSLEEAIERLLVAAPADPRGALFLCAWLSKRAQLHDEPERSRLLRRLAVLAVGAKADAIEGARRYADLRTTLADLGQRIAEVASRSRARTDPDPLTLFVLATLPRDPAQVLAEARELDALEAMALTATQERDRILFSPAGEWLRAEIDARPALQFEELPARSDAPYR